MSQFPSLLAQFNGVTIPGGTGTIVAHTDLNATTPLPITDLQGVPITGGMLTASATGVLPAFRTLDHRQVVSWVSGPHRMDIPAVDVIPPGGAAGQVLALGLEGQLVWTNQSAGTGEGGSTPPQQTPQAPTPPEIEDLPAGSVFAVHKAGSTWPERPTDRSDVTVIWVGAEPSPEIVTSGKTGMRATDLRFVTS